MELSRRTFVGLLGGSAAMAMGGLALPTIAEVAGSAAHATTGAITGVNLDVSTHGASTGFPYPFFTDWSDVMAESQDYLNDLAVSYGRVTPAAQQEPADFWFRYAPIPLFERAMTGALSGDSTETMTKTSLWVMHLVGYFGGVWFKKKLNQFSPTGSGGIPSTSPPAAPTEADFAALMAYLREAVPAAYGTDATALGFAEHALRYKLGSTVPTGLGDVLTPLITLYGYNVGYTDNILRPPHRAYPPPVNANGPTVFSPPWNSQQATPQGLFDASFPDFSVPNPTVQPIPPDPSGFTPVPILTGDEPALATARQRFGTAWAGRGTNRWHAIVDGDPTQQQLPLPILQAAGYNVGNATWSLPIVLDVTHWDRPSYVQIIGLSVYFVQAVQLAGMACLAAAATTDAPGARDACLAAALVQPFGGSYLVGLNAAGSPAYASKSPDQSVPGFTYAN